MAYFPEDLEATLSTVADGMRRRRVPFAIGGGAAYSTYIGYWRATKDLDFYIVPADREAAIEALSLAGFSDYYERQPYDRAWIYRGFQGDQIVDVIWAMANHSSEVDQRWVAAGPEVRFGPETVRLIPPEELIYAKLYVLQRDRCDWPDVLNMLRVTGPDLNWGELLRRLGSDAPLLGGVLSVFCWLAPEQAARLPGWVLERFHLKPEPGSAPARAHADLLDRRPWFVPAIHAPSAAGAAGACRAEDSAR